MIAGDRFGKLTFVRETGERRNNWRMGLFACDCGSKTEARMSRVKNGYTRSCGCLVVGRVPTHGMRKSREYRIWTGMKTRCLNPKSKDYARYGGRGITVCDRWRLSFEAFYADMGPRPRNCDLHRVDNARGYEPGNCVWLPHSEHMQLHYEAR